MGTQQQPIAMDAEKAEERKSSAHPPTADEPEVTCPERDWLPESAQGEDHTLVLGNDFLDQRVAFGTRFDL